MYFLVSTSYGGAPEQRLGARVRKGLCVPLGSRRTAPCAMCGMRGRFVEGACQRGVRGLLHAWQRCVRVWARFGPVLDVISIFTPNSAIIGVFPNVVVRSVVALGCARVGVITLVLVRVNVVTFILGAP